MRMTPREIIKRNLEFSGPERIGLAFSWPGLINDIVGVNLGPSPKYRERSWVKDNVEYSDDEWGNIWHRIIGKTTHGEIYKPAIEDWSQLADFKLPDLTAPERYEAARIAFSQDTDHYRSGSLPGFTFAICRYLRKMEVYLQDLLLERKNIDELHERVTSLLADVIKRFAVIGADGVNFCEDWGLQDRLMISPGMWRDIFKPLYKRLCDTAHSCGMNVIMHSCGYNWDILDDLAEVGINGVNFNQAEIYGLERLAAKLRELKICLLAPVDCQKIMPTGNRELITSTARKMVKLFGREEGGFIATGAGGNLEALKSIGVEPEWAQWAYDAFIDCI